MKCGSCVSKASEGQGVSGAFSMCRSCVGLVGFLKLTVGHLNFKGLWRLCAEFYIDRRVIKVAVQEAFQEQCWKLLSSCNILKAPSCQSFGSGSGIVLFELCSVWSIVIEVPQGFGLSCEPNFRKSLPEHV